MLFHFDDDVRLHIYHIRGRMQDLTGHHVVVLDDKRGLQLAISEGLVGTSASDLTLILNRYVFGYRGSPLHNLSVRMEGDHIVQTGVMHKLIDIPFALTAKLSVTPDGLLRVHTTRMRICSLNGLALLKAVGKSLASMLNLKGAKGVRAEGNDLFIDVLAIMPPPIMRGRLTSVKVQGNEIVQTFVSMDGTSLPPLTPPVVAPNYIYFRGGTIRFGKLFMVGTDLLTIDADSSDPFDFYLDYYQKQLSAGYSVTMPNRALVTYMPDFAKLDANIVKPVLGNQVR